MSWRHCGYWCSCRLAANTSDTKLLAQPTCPRRSPLRNVCTARACTACARAGTSSSTSGLWTRRSPTAGEYRASTCVEIAAAITASLLPGTPATATAGLTCIHCHPCCSRCPLLQLAGQRRALLPGGGSLLLAGWLAGWCRAGHLSVRLHIRHSQPIQVTDDAPRLLAPRN